MLALMFYLSSLDIAGLPRDDYQVRLGLLAGHPDVHVVTVHHLAHPHPLLSNDVTMELVRNGHLQKFE